MTTSMPILGISIVTTPLTLSILFVLVFAAAIFGKILVRKGSRSLKAPNETTGIVVDDDNVDAYTSITPLSTLKWQDQEPLAFRPFKPKYNLTMALENLTINELVEVDKTYGSRIQLRRRILRDHPSTSSLRPGSEDAVMELYSWMTTVYLPRRFPTMYSLGDGEKVSHLRNRATGEDIALYPESAGEALRILGSHVDTDFLVLLPSAGDGKYHLEAFVTCFPSGFSTLEKLGSSLAAVHAPVPGYAAKLEKSMDRFFANIPVGRIVKRVNWSITTNDALYAESGNHLYADGGDRHGDAGPSVDDEIERQKAEVRVPDCRLRNERQTLHRLPKTKALVFAFKTYTTPLEKIKAEGSGEDLARAIEGLGKGNVADMEFYKRGVVWGDKVKEYLRR